MENVTHGKMNSRVRGSFFSLEGKKNPMGQGEKERKEEKKKKRKGRKGKKKLKKRKKRKKNEGDCVRVRGGKKKRTTLPFAISSEPAVETRRGKRQSWSTR